MRLFTIGHSVLPWPVFIDTLKSHEIDCLVDVRSYPGSRRYPHFNKENLSPQLWGTHNIAYEHIPELGGRRRKSVLDRNLNSYWTHPSFRNYADYALSPEFESGMRQLLDLAATYNKVAYMCSESVWWKCHRRIITDYLLARNHDVIHIINGKESVAKINESAVCCDEHHHVKLRYPGAQSVLAL